MLEGHVGGLERQCPILADSDVLGEGAASAAEHLIPRSKPLHVPADRFDRPCKIDAHSCGRRCADAGIQAHDVRRSPHVVPVERIDRGRANPDQDFIVRRRRLFDVLHLENIGRTITAVNDGLHPCRIRGKRIRRAARRVVTHGGGQGQQHDGDDDRDGAQHFPNHGASPLESIVDARAGEAVCPRSAKPFATSHAARARWLRPNGRSIRKTMR